MNIFTNLILSGVIALVSMFGAYKYIPLSWYEGNTKPIFGSVLTTIQGTDTLSSSRTTINNNFTSLNNGKIENSTTSVASITTLPNLVSIGTITTGVWSGTALTWAKGGNASTTLSINQVLLGDTTTGFKVVSGYGTTGQFLTSTGSGTAPTWQTSAIDQTANYNWTGSHYFATSTIYNLNTGAIHATGTVTVNGIPLYPSTVTLFNGYGGGTLTSGTASTTLKTITLPANTLSSTKSIRGRAFFGLQTAQGGSVNTCQIDFGTGSATTTIAYNHPSASIDTFYGANFNFNLYATTTSAEIAKSEAVVTPDLKLNQFTTTLTTTVGSKYIPYSTTGTLYLAFICSSSTGNDYLTLQTATIEQIIY